MEIVIKVIETVIVMEASTMATKMALEMATSIMEVTMETLMAI